MSTPADDIKAVYEYMKQYSIEPQTIFAHKGFGDAVREAAKAIGMVVKVIEVTPVFRCNRPRRCTYKTIRMDCAKRNRHK